METVGAFRKRVLSHLNTQNGHPDSFIHTGTIQAIFNGDIVNTDPNIVIDFNPFSVSETKPMQANQAENLMKYPILVGRWKIVWRHVDIGWHHKFRRATHHPSIGTKSCLQPWDSTSRCSWQQPCCHPQPQHLSIIPHRHHWSTIPSSNEPSPFPAAVAMTATKAKYRSPTHPPPWPMHPSSPPPTLP